ncbi:O-acetyl-ADP-ribose deacetylase [Pleionea sediminis]|uniref:O-acetyl-ADP-ribose deacetylase n=1 Tax=Pleionea sediminis TaxID=2569479 RepID=UPI0011856F08|nr:O-acetyl-ADP-ribose deacetylase [Pleionea sediminis]
MKDRLKTAIGDITHLPVDAIVNAANRTLCGGGGVDGAIHRAAGPELLEHCRTLGGCNTGDAKLTQGYNLPASFIIHTVGPVWDGGDKNEQELLASCYQRCMALAEENDIRSIAFPVISCGAYRFPLELAVSIAVEQVAQFLQNSPLSIQVTFCCFDAKTASVYKKEIESQFS